jgi:hypothetical protein
MTHNNCLKCNGKGLLFFQKDAPCPPYKEGSKLDYVRFCDCIPPVKTNESGVY